MNQTKVIKEIKSKCRDALYYFNKLQGVREGTIAAALLVGMIVSFYNRKFTFLARWIE